MCTVCGCGHSSTKPFHQLGRAKGAEVAALPSGEVSAGARHLHFGANAAGVTVPGLSERRVLELEQDVLGRNDEVARANRAAFAASGTLALNLVSSPGSGKTTLLTETLQRLIGEGRPVAVIEGDQQTTFDADRIAATGAPAIQINTGKGCHLDALMVRDALARLPAAEEGILFIENVGNLVCPAGFDLGEAHKVALLSVTEGEDKPLKYPDMFHAADVMLLTKIDLLPYTGFDVERCLDFARRVNPGLEVFLLSSRSGQGMDAWLEWLRVRVEESRRTRG